VQKFLNTELESWSSFTSVFLISIHRMISGSINTDRSPIDAVTCFGFILFTLFISFFSVSNSVLRASDGRLSEMKFDLTQRSQRQNLANVRHAKRKPNSDVGRASLLHQTIATSLRRTVASQSTCPSPHLFCSCNLTAHTAR